MKLNCLPVLPASLRYEKKSRLVHAVQAPGNVMFSLFRPPLSNCSMLASAMSSVVRPASLRTAFEPGHPWAPPAPPRQCRYRRVGLYYMGRVFAIAHLILGHRHAASVHLPYGEKIIPCYA